MLPLLLPTSASLIVKVIHKKFEIFTGMKSSPPENRA